MKTNALEQLPREELIGKILSLQHQLEELKRMVFGAKSERFVPVPPNQLSLGFEDDVPIEEAPAVHISYTKKKAIARKPGGRQLLPEHLERKEIIIEPEGNLEGLKKIGEEVKEQLEYQPGKLFVNRFVRPKYARPEEGGGTTVLIAPLPESPIWKGIPGASLLSQVIVDKFVDHLPVYRQVKRYDRLGVKLSPSTICGWMESACALLQPLYNALQTSVLTGSYLQVDETPIKVLNEGSKGHAHSGYFWVYQNPASGLVLFDYQPGRNKAGPLGLLRDFTGYLQADGYSVYEDSGVGRKQGVTLMHCMAHARRYFEKALDNDRPRAEHFLKEVQLLYALERKCREQALDEGQIVDLRQNEAVPILERMGKWLKDNYMQVLPKSPIGRAIAYASARWERLSIYVQEARLQIDNNLVENAIRPVAIGRKNFLFAGSREGAERAAMIYSIVGSCIKHGINPNEYICDILNRLPTIGQDQIQELLPGRWKPL